MKLYLFFVTVFIVSCSTVTFGQDDTKPQEELRLKEFKSDMLILRTFEVIAGAFYPSKLSISDGVTETWSIELKGTKAKTTDENLTTITKVVHLLMLQGYRLTHTNSGNVANGLLVSNYIFEKKSQ